MVANSVPTDQRRRHLTTGVGQHQMLGGAIYIQIPAPALTSAGLGAMGYGFPARSAPKWFPETGGGY